MWLLVNAQTVHSNLFLIQSIELEWRYPWINLLLCNIRKYIIILHAIVQLLHNNWFFFIFIIFFNFFHLIQDAFLFIPIQIQIHIQTIDNFCIENRVFLAVPFIFLRQHIIYFIMLYVHIHFMRCDAIFYIEQMG